MDSQMRAARPTPKPTPETRSNAKANSKRRFTKFHLLLMAVMVALIVALASYALMMAPSQVDKDRYQAVFLNNGQVYFGKLHGFSGQRPYMTDVYYFPPNEAGQAEQEQSLIKLGEEVHRPDNKMIFNIDSILFVENLSNESSVVQAIERG